MSSSQLNLNGKLVAANQAVLFSQNRAFRFGDGVFESIRFAFGKALWMDYHWERLLAGMQLLGLNIPDNWDAGYFENQILLCCQANEFQQARVRLSVYRQDGGLYVPENNFAAFLMEASPIADPLYGLNAKGLLIDIYTRIAKPYNVLSGLKTHNALLYILAAQHARAKNLDDALILNDSGLIAEATSSNIFLVKEGKLYTPGLDEACVNGVMRRVIMKIAAENKIPVYDCSLSTDDLLQADEIFLTNAISGLRWVLGFKQKRFFHQMSNKINTLLNEKVNTIFISESDL